MADPRILDYIIEIKETVGKVEQHLIDLNGKVLRHSQEIDENRERIAQINKRIAYLGGGLAVVIFAIEVGIAVIR